MSSKWCFALFFIACFFFTAPTRVATQDVGVDSSPDLFDVPELPGEILLGVKYGFAFPTAFPAISGSWDIVQGLVLENPVRKIFIQKAIHDQILLHFDYDATREGSFLAGNQNVYSILYRGLQGEFLQELSLGNEYLSIQGSRFDTIDSGDKDSFALRAIGQAGGFGVEGILRYGAALQGKKRFRGNKQVIETEVRDIDYVKARFFLLPDSRVAEDSLVVLRSTTGNHDLLIGGRRFQLLVRNRDFELDNSTGKIILRRSLAGEEELLVYYEKNGYSVGSDQLGSQAVIDAGGNRVDFRLAAFPDYGQYFVNQDGTDYLYLRKDGFNSYWEMRNGYYLEGLAGAEAPGDLSVELVYTAQGGINENYLGLLESRDFYGDVLFFDFFDAQGFYPRPFPGIFPFTHPVTPDNPFDPANPIYGGIGYPGEDDSINTLRLRYTIAVDSFFLDFDILRGSVAVTVEGQMLPESLYQVDYDTGIITFQPGVLGPYREAEVTYRYVPFGGAPQELFSAVGIRLRTDRIGVFNLLSLTVPLVEIPAPTLGEERRAAIKNSSELSLLLGAPPGETGVYGEVEASAALALSDSNIRDTAMVADMTDDDSIAIGLSDQDWMVASTSQLLPALLVPLATRGPLIYENYWDSSLLFGDVLRDLAWDNSSHPAFSYSEKAGPYNTSDRPPNGADRSLVLDFSFSAGNPDPFVTVALPLYSTRLDDADSVMLVVRGEGVGGDSIRIYAEVLSAYQEDLNGNDVLDGETSILQQGFSLVPQGGSPTVFGTDREGEANGRIDSEDLDGNGYLDPLGPYASDQEKGVVLTTPAGIEYVTELAAGDDGWKRVSVDIRSAVQAHPDVFRQVKALRLTLKPATPTPGVPVSGKVIVNEIRFAGSHMVNETPSHLSLREISTLEDTEVAANAFSLSFPETYEKLHGRESYRDKQGHIEKVLEFRLTADLPSGAPVVSHARFSRTFAIPRDVSPYRSYRMYLFLPSGQSLPSDAAVTLKFVSALQESMDVTLASSVFQSGWNEIAVSLESPFQVQVNGSTAGNMVRSGTLNVLKRLLAIEFGLQSGVTIIPQDFRLWLDEWHVSESRLYFHQAFQAEGVMGYRGGLLPVGEMFLLGDPSVMAGFDWQGPVFLGSLDEYRGRLYGSLSATVLNALYADVHLAHARERPGETGSYEDLGFGLPIGDNTNRCSYSLILDPGRVYLPILGHSFNRLVTESGDLQLDQTDYRLGNLRLYDESLDFTERYRLSDDLVQEYGFVRSWDYSNRQIYETGGSLLNTLESLSLNQIHRGSLSFRQDFFALDLNLLRDDVYSTSDTGYPVSPFASYAQKMGTLFRRAELALPGGRLDSRTDRGFLALSVPPARFIGLESETTMQAQQNGFDHAVGTRNLFVSEALSLAIPLSLLAEEQLLLTPSAKRTFTGSFRTVQDSLTEAEVLARAYGILFQLPFYYLHPDGATGRLHEYAAVDTLAGSTAIAGASSNALTTTLSLDARLKAESWFLPTGMSLSVEGQTQREGLGYSQKRTVSAGIDKSGKLESGTLDLRGSLAMGADYQHTRDYTLKLWIHQFSMHAAMSCLGKENRQLSMNLSFFFDRELQRMNDERLSLLPGSPSADHPVPFLPDQDKLKTSFSVHYGWDSPVKAPSGKPAASRPESRIRHEERFLVESRYSMVDPADAVDLINLPIGVVLEHTTRLMRTDFQQFDLKFKLSGGLEERITDGAIDLLPSFGFGLEVTARFLF